MINVILYANLQGYKAVMFDNFRCDITSNKAVPISSIFDFDALNRYTKSKLNIVVFDRNYAVFRLHQCLFGVEKQYNDVTDILEKKFINRTSILIPSNINFNSLCGDPCFGKKKHILLRYFINDTLIEERHDENRDYNIKYDVNTQHFQFYFGWIDRLNRTLFDEMLLKLQYMRQYTSIVDQFKEQNLNTNGKINVIHLRIEEDAIKHWSKQNEMSQDDFKTYIISKYKTLIKKYLSKDDINLILSYSTDNEVVDYMRQEGYSVIFTKKEQEGRELNAMIDLLISFNCNGTFIGNFNLELLNGSSFSYYIIKKIKGVKVLLDLDRIRNDEVVHY